MKKIIAIWTTALTVNLFVMLYMTGCIHCDDTTSKIISFDDCMRRDNNWMEQRYGNDYRWYECGITMKSYLDEDKDGAIYDLTNVFMVRSDPGKSYDTNIILLHHGRHGDGVYHLESQWVQEDVSMKQDQINVIFKESLVKAKSVKPLLHTKHVVLRKQLGPNDSNPQYIYGNNHGFLFIDATTGTVSHDSPALSGTDLATKMSDWPE